MSELSTVYDPKSVEDEIYQRWVDADIFRCSNEGDKKAHTIMIPLPNVTGVLHMGHALNNTLQDLVTRFRRMQGFEALWLPGTDHAGVATQAVVERHLWETERKNRDEIGREEFLKRVWQWKETNGGFIINQLKKLGASCDWSRERFTMDEMLSKAVRHVFVQLFKDGLIYRGKRLVNWSCPLKTALSNDELEYEKIKTHFWHINYPVKDEPGRFITIATTRPETMLGDTAVAVHPEDVRYKDLVGKSVVLPFVNREIPVIADDYVAIDEGTGALKVTPAHDFNDFEIGLRHGLPKVNILHPNGVLNENAGPYQGLDRLKARPKIVEALEELGLLVKIVDHVHEVAHCYRSRDIIEPYLSDQWFVKMGPFVELARKAERAGRVKFHPERWAHTFHQWLDTTPDWCISRQIWWGHRIPVWTCGNCAAQICEFEDPTSCPECGGKQLEQDPDVLDTWFSSQIWPFSTLGWPDETPDLKKFYPTDVLITARDIIALWVARMIMMGEYFLKEEPFAHVYINGTILDRQGRRMSKSLRNGIDPIVMIDGGTDLEGREWEGFGADAVRFTLVTMTTEGQDLRIWPERFKDGQAFCNKVWNASRFCLMNLENGERITPLRSDIDPSTLGFQDRWILSRLNSTIQAVTEALDGFKFCDAARLVREFTWNEFCAWTVELTKFRLRDDERSDPEDSIMARRVLAFVIDQTLKLLHPMCPYITEEIWTLLNERIPERSLNGAGESAGEFIMTAPWPQVNERFIDPAVEREMTEIQGVVRAIRNIRATAQIHHAAELKCYVQTENEQVAGHVRTQAEMICNIGVCRFAEVGPGVTKPPKSASEVLSGLQVHIPLEGVIDIDKEIARHLKKVENLEKRIVAAERKLGNASFVERAPQEIVERERATLKEMLESRDQILAQIESLKD